MRQACLPPPAGSPRKLRANTSRLRDPDGAGAKRFAREGTGGGEADQQGEAGMAHYIPAAGTSSELQGQTQCFQDGTEEGRQGPGAFSTVACCGEASGPHCLLLQAFT